MFFQEYLYMDNHKLLFVDDEPNILSSLKRLFQNESYEIYTASDGYEALKLMSEHTFSLILSDYRMPKLNGIEFLNMAKEISPDTMRIMLTGFADIDIVISAVNKGKVYKFIAKPWDGENLKVQVTRAIEHYELVQERKVLLEKIKIQNEQLKYVNESLEEQVIERTKELGEAYKELEMKVKELWARDKILQFLLSVHDLEETLDLIIEEIMEIERFDKIAIYVTDKEKEAMVPQAVYALRNNEKIKINKDEIDLPVLPIPNKTAGGGKTLDNEAYAHKINEYSYFIPILKDGICLGAIFIENAESKDKMDENDLEIMTGFSSLAALAINDYFVTSSLPDMQHEIDEMLKELR